MPTLAAVTSLADGTTPPGANARWSAGSTATGGNGAPVGALNCGPAASTQYTYAHLNIFYNGQLQALPTDVGRVNPSVTANKALQLGCVYPVHTDDLSGKIRLDASATTPYTLGQFFAVWGQPLTTTQVADLSGQPVSIYVKDDGGALTKYNGDPAALPLNAKREITISVGSPLAEVPTYAWTDPAFRTPAFNLTAGVTIGETDANWGPPPSKTGPSLTGQPVDGTLTCGAMVENYHVHAHLAIIRDGKLLQIPQNIGIVSTPQSCVYELHVHDKTGMIHVETAGYKRFTLGQLFDIWGQPLVASDNVADVNVAGIMGLPLTVYIHDNGDLRRFMGDPRDIELTSHRAVTLVLGSALTLGIPTYNWVDETQ